MNIPLFTMNLFIKNFNKNKLNKILMSFNKKIGENFNVKLYLNEKSYKYPDREECWIYVYSKKYVSLKEILYKYKQIEWKYNSIGRTSFSKDGIRCLFSDEDAFWNYEFQKESFLHSDITWVNFIAFPIEPRVAESENFD
jgi:hypothetical protein